jgi:hypothetical protein
MGWLRSLVCFLSNSRRLTEEEEEEPGNGGAAMAPITRSQCKISRLVDLNTLDANFGNTTRPFLLRSSKRQRIKEEALKEYDIDHVEESRSAAAAADAEALTVPSPSPSKCEPIISSPGRKKKKLLSISICFFFPCNAHSNLLHSSSKNASQRSYYYILNSVTMGLLLSSFREF